MEGEREAAKQLEILRSLLVCMPTTTGLASWGGQRGAQLTNGIADQKKPIGNAVRLLFFPLFFCVKRGPKPVFRRRQGKNRNNNNDNNDWQQQA